nr:MAG TPA: autophagocytosis associated protein [Caudoviricetes sp.]
MRRYDVYDFFTYWIIFLKFIEKEYTHVPEF